MPRSQTIQHEELRQKQWSNFQHGVGLIRGQMDALRRRRNVQAPIEINLSNNILDDLEKAKRILM